MRKNNRTCRHLECDYEEYFYKPRSRPVKDLNTIILSKDEMEALRLVDGTHQSQNSAAQSMGISSSTIQRVIEHAREKIIMAIVNGDAIKVEGGNYRIKKGGTMSRGDGTGPDGKGPGTGRGLGKRSGNKSGVGKGVGRGAGSQDHDHNHDHDDHEQCNDRGRGAGRGRNRNSK